MTGDENVDAARLHWGARFTANGIPAADFNRTVNEIQRWEDWCAAWVVLGNHYAALADTALTKGHTHTAGSLLSLAATTYHFGKFVFVIDADQMRSAHELAVDALNRALPYLDPAGERVVIPFDGAFIYGVLRLPAGDGPHPIVILAPGLDSTKEEFRTTEDSFLSRGLATLSIDGPGQGEAEYSLLIRPDWEVVGQAVIDHLMTDNRIDHSRIGVWGVSLGGYYAPRMASGDDRIKACIALTGPYDFSEAWDDMPALTRATFQHRSGAPTANAAKAKAAELSLSGRTELIKCPTLIVAGKQDRLIPWKQAARVHDEIADSEFLFLPSGNHGCANVWPEHRLQAADWMVDQLDAR